MKFTRRETMVMAGVAGAATVMPLSLFADEAMVTEAINGFTEGADIAEGGVELTTPEIAENGNTVPVEVSAEGATAIMLLAEGNPTPNVVVFNFGPKAGAAAASTRIRLAGTQNVTAIAKLADGSFAKASKEVKVTIGGCGG